MRRHSLVRTAVIVWVFLFLSWVRLEAAPVLTTYELTPGWATFGLVLPTGVARDGVQVASLQTQTDVKTTWPDGSIRFAVVTCYVPAKGRYPIVQGRSDAGRLSVVWPSASVEFVIGGQRWTATLPDGGNDIWLAGSLVSEKRVLVAPVLGGLPHAFLRVIFDVRSYADRSHRVDITVENTLDDESADQVTYDVGVRLGPGIVFQKDGVNHQYLTRWRKTFGLALTEAMVVPDFTSFVQAGAIPRYLPTIRDVEYSLDRSAFDILKPGDLHVPMDGHGGRPEIAPYPDWTARYLVHKRHSQRQYMLRHGEAAGAFAVHIKEADSVRLVSIDERPNFWLDSRADDDGRPRNGMRGAGIPGDIAHQPSLAYVPYLVTGDRFFLDEMKYWANYCLIGTFQDGYYNARNGSEGLLYRNEVRGIGWALRNLGDAAAYVPDTDRDRSYFIDKVENNLRWLEEYALTFQTPLGTLFTPHRPEDEDSPYTHIALWEQTYVAWAVDHLLGHGFSTGATLRDRIVGFQLRLFTSDREGYDRRYAGPYALAVGRKVGRSYSFFETIGEVFRVTYLEQGRTLRTFAGNYGVEARLMLMIAAAQQRMQADEALNYLMSTPGMEADVNDRSGWAIDRGIANVFIGYR